MLTYKIGSDIVVPVVLTVTATGLAHTGVAFGSVTVTVIRSNGTTVTYTPTVAQWTEYSANAFTGSGYYNLVIPAADANLAGALQYGVAVTGDAIYFGVVDLVTNLATDAYNATVEVLGMLHKNGVVTNQTYNVGGHLTGATLQVYDTSAHAILNDGVTGLLKTYTIVAAYDAQSHQTLYRLVSVP